MQFFLDFRDHRDDELAAELLVQPGSELTVLFTAIPSAGYVWQLTALPDELTVLAADESVAPHLRHSDPEQQLIGGPSVATFHFRVDEQPTGTLVFQYRRPWEDKAPLRVCTVRFTPGSLSA